MKKINVFLLLIFFCSVAYNQDSKLALGFEFGPTVPRLTGNSIVNKHDLRISFMSGLSLVYSLNDRISLKSGLSFERKGSGDKIQMTDNYGNDAGTQYVKINYDYLVLPVLFSYATKGKNKFYVNAGPYFAYLLSCKEIFESAGTVSGYTIDHKDDTKKIDTGLSFGFGFNFPLSKKLLLDIGTRENIGFINTSKVDVIDNGSIRTLSFDLIFGLKYKF